MPVTLAYPGVHNGEIPSAVRTIVGIPTSTAAFVGTAPKGPDSTAASISSPFDHEQTFGRIRASPLGVAVSPFFRNGGAQAPVVSVAGAKRRFLFSAVQAPGSRPRCCPRYRGHQPPASRWPRCSRAPTPSAGFEGAGRHLHSVSGAVKLANVPADDGGGRLSPVAINGLRTLPAAGNVAWGARTMVGSDLKANQWKCVPVCRLALLIEEALFRGSRRAVFKSNERAVVAASSAERRRVHAHAVPLRPKFEVKLPERRRHGAAHLR